jgi:hypothetical protein
MVRRRKEPSLTISARTVLACARPTLGNLASRQTLPRRTGRLPSAVRLFTARDATMTAFSWVSSSWTAASLGRFCRDLTAPRLDQLAQKPRLPGACKSSALGQSTPLIAGVYRYLRSGNALGCRSREGGCHDTKNEIRASFEDYRPGKTE